MCDKNNIKDQYVTNLKLKGLKCDQNNLKDQSVTNLKLKDPKCNLAYIFYIKKHKDYNF